MNASEQITQHINDLGDWRGRILARLRRLILDTAPELVEEWKWNTPVWSHKGNVVAAGDFQDHVKINFFKGASLADPDGLFNASLEAKATRAIDISEGDVLNEAALRRLIRAAVALNSSGQTPGDRSKQKPGPKQKPALKQKTGPKQKTGRKDAPAKTQGR